VGERLIMNTRDTFHLDALDAQRLLRQRLASIARSENFLRTPSVASACEALWSSLDTDSGLVGELWVEPIFPVESSSNTLAEMQSIAPRLIEQLRHSGAFPVDRLLHLHQERAIDAEIVSRKSGRRPGIVVTAGTGAGKTEAFLLPMLNELFSEPRKPGERGVRAIILYPLNALVNDQVDRLYKWLGGQKDVTLFHYTGETPENEQSANEERYPIFDMSRRRSRGEARQNVPDILITNYSMLEYMLCRPQDEPFFGSALRTMVLDEAHLYSGTLAAEITLLLRRILLRCDVKSEDVLQIATSATLGGDESNLVRFAAELFSKDPGLVLPIAGKFHRRALLAAEPAALPAAPAIFVEMAQTAQKSALVDEHDLCTDPDLAQAIREHGRGFVSLSTISRVAAETRPACVLHALLSQAPEFQRMEQFFWDRGDQVKILLLKDVVEHMWGAVTPETVRATTALMQMGAQARLNADDLPLLPHKLHLLSRAPGTMTACLNPACTAPPEIKLEGAGGLIPRIADRCSYCSAATLTVCRCGRCGQELFAGVRRRDETLHPRARWRDEPAFGTQPVYFFGRLSQSGKGTPFDFLTREIDETQNSAWLEERNTCPNCAADSEEFRPLSLSDGLVLPVVAETLLSTMPIMRGAARAWLPAQGRRLLIFSDSRREAARLGPLLTRSHEIQMGRALLNATLQELIPDSGLLRVLDRDILRLREDLDDPGLTPPAKALLEGRLQLAVEKRASVDEGVSVPDLSRHLALSPTLAEFFYRQAASMHSADTWNQAIWEKNARHVRQHGEQLLIRELAVPAWGRISLESAALAEVVYPGLNTAEPLARLLGQLPQNPAKQLTGLWSTYLASLLDSMRRDRAISLGSPERDAEEYDTPLGHWISLDSRLGSNLIPLRGRSDRARRRRLTRTFLERIGCSSGLDALHDDMLEAAFHQLLQMALSRRFAWLETGERQARQGAVPAVRIVFEHLRIRRPISSFRCHVTGELWPRSLAGLSPRADGACDLR
jgi:DEAD/DEAH box helicase domain-containing protein